MAQIERGGENSVGTAFVNLLRAVGYSIRISYEDLLSNYNDYVTKKQKEDREKRLHEYVERFKRR